MTWSKSGDKKGRSRSRSGVILILVLLFLTLSAVVVAQSHSAVMRRNSLASDAEKELQERWAITSLRSALLDQSEISPLAAIYSTNSETQSGTFPSDLHKWSGHIVLSGLRYELSLFDENAKIPASLILADRNDLDSRRVLNEAISQATRLKIPLPKSADSMSDLLELDTSLKLDERFRILLQSAELVSTCSDGKINFWSTTDDVINLVWNWRFGNNAPAQLLKRKEWNRDQPLAANFASLGLTNSDTQFALSVFTDRTTTHSLWIEQRRANGKSGFCGYYVARLISGFSDNHFGYHWP